MSIKVVTHFYVVTYFIKLYKLLLGQAVCARIKLQPFFLTNHIFVEYLIMASLTHTFSYCKLYNIK